MKRIIIAAVMLMVLACTAYGITECDRPAEGGQKPLAAVTEETEATEMTGASYTGEPETCVTIARVGGSRAAVRLYSTTRISEPSYYDLYTIEKEDGVWQKKAYIRTVEFPSTVNTREGKYQYYTENVRIDWLQKGHVYQLIPQAEGNHHSSVPFWRKDKK